MTRTLIKIALINILLQLVPQRAIAQCNVTENTKADSLINILVKAENCGVDGVLRSSMDSIVKSLNVLLFDTSATSLDINRKIHLFLIANYFPNEIFYRYGDTITRRFLNGQIDGMHNLPFVIPYAITINRGIELAQAIMRKYSICK